MTRPGLYQEGYMRSSLLRGNLAVVSLWLLSLGLLLGAAHPQRAQAANRVYRPGEVIVKIDPAAGITDDDLNAELGTTTLQELDSDAPVYLLRTPPGVDPKALCDRMELDRRLV